jgi:hypothetical protein
MKLVTIAFCFLLFLAGCAATQPTIHWVRPDTTQDQFEQDMAACRFATEAANNPNLVQIDTAGGLAGALGNMAIISANQDRQTRMFQDCMRSKGYKIVPTLTSKGANQEGATVQSQ